MADLDRYLSDLPNGQITIGVAGAAKAIDVSKETIRKAIREGRLKSILLGRRRLIFMDDLLAWTKGE